MAVPASSPAQAATPEATAPMACDPLSTLEEELRSAAEDFDRGDYLELSDAQIARCIATGESPWPDESRG